MDFGPQRCVKTVILWVQLNGLSPECLEKSGDLDASGHHELIADFGADTGLWARESDSTWSFLHRFSRVAPTIGNIDGN